MVEAGFRDAKVLVTGASGFLGGHLVRELVRQGYSVVGMVRKTSNIRKLEDLGLEVRFGDLTDGSSLIEATKGIDVIMHLAAYYTFSGKSELYRKVNVEGTRNLCEAAVKNKVKRIFYCSSTEAIGPVKVPPGDENTPPNPQYEYGRSKLMAEEIVRSFGVKGLEYTIIRPTGIYGPENVDDVSYWFITSFAKRSLATRIIVGSGQNLIQFVHVQDAVQGFSLALNKFDISKNQTYIIGEDRAYTYNEVYRILSEICKIDPPSIHIPPSLAKLLIAPVGFVKRLLGDENFMWRVSTVDSVTTDRAYNIDKAKKELGYRPRYDLKKGLEETVKWYRDKGMI
ncbi:MAG: NAD-dependent epimerase/dehydratase family protein [Candidatus Methanomethyliales bacterium]|nr:NAD-dependent epimerase/dehydratase family protein [Candidatus Methanomethylicales archaeon]